MRSLGFSKTGSDVWNQMAELCCACGLCTLYACPEDLFPKEACDKSKKEMRSAGMKYIQEKPVKVHPMKEGRRVPLKQLVKKLRLEQYDGHTPFTDKSPAPVKVKIPLKQHVGEIAVPLVSEGETVSRGAKIAHISGGKLGSEIHASISGRITEVTQNYISIKA
jgi:Na+-translocating ferredoxin:NAD+ oxidoreductase RnfC subunit